MEFTFRAPAVHEEWLRLRQAESESSRPLKRGPAAGGFQRSDELQAAGAAGAAVAAFGKRSNIFLTASLTRS
jgi:hypothetical protein